MASRNVEAAMAEHQAFNRRDFRLAMFADDCVYVDMARGVTARGRAEIKEHLQGWTRTMSDAEVHEPSYLDAGDAVIAQFTGRGTQDGPLGPFPPLGRSAKLPFCEIMRFDREHQISSITAYYDQMGLLAQLGHLPAPG